jgi:hypothetical protein
MIKMVDSLLLLVLYVDDLLITGCSTSAIAAVKRILHDRFLMIDMVHYTSSLDLRSVKMHQALKCLKQSMHDISLRDFT